MLYEFLIQHEEARWETFRRAERQARVRAKPESAGGAPRRAGLLRRVVQGSVTYWDRNARAEVLSRR
jgi:hypothetical protein